MTDQKWVKYKSSTYNYRINTFFLGLWNLLLNCFLQNVLNHVFNQIVRTMAYTKTIKWSKGCYWKKSIGHASEIGLELMIKLTIYSVLKNKNLVGPTTTISSFNRLSPFSTGILVLSPIQSWGLPSLQLPKAQCAFDLDGSARTGKFPEEPVERLIWYRTGRFTRLYFIWGSARKRIGTFTKFDCAFLWALPRCLGWVINESGTWSSARRGVRTNAN